MSDNGEIAPASGQRGELDEELEVCVRLASQMRTLGSLYHALVHDLKSPLNTLLVDLELLAASLDPEDERDERRRRYARVLKEEMLRLDRSIEGLLPVAAPPGGTAGRFDMVRIVGEVETLLASHASHKRIALETAVPDERLLVDGHRDRVRLAVLAVAVNGLEAMPDGGRLRIEASRREDRVLVAVEDTGDGIARGAERQVYDLSFTTKERQGGFGLHAAREVVKLTKGTMTFDTEPGRGTRFELRFPVAN